MFSTAIDLTHPLNASTPYWPGPRNMPFHAEPFATLSADGVFEGRISMDEHTGTHIDAPNHFIDGGRALHDLEARELFVPAAVVDARAQVARDTDYRLTVDDLLAWESAHGRVPAGAVVFMFTGWDERWHDFTRYKNADAAGRLHFPGFSAESARWLVEEREVSGLGIDALSVDHGVSQDFPVHQVSHGHGKYHLENVANLGRLPAQGAFLLVAPLNIQDASGSPVRLFAVVTPTKEQ